VRVGVAGVVGMGLPHRPNVAAHPTARAKSMLIVRLSGGPSQLDPLGRRNHLLNGDVIMPLYSGRSA